MADASQAVAQLSNRSSASRGTRILRPRRRVGICPVRAISYARPRLTPSVAAASSTVYVNRGSIMLATSICSIKWYLTFVVGRIDS